MVYSAHLTLVISVTTPASLLPGVQDEVLCYVIPLGVNLLPPLKHLGVPDHHSIQLVAQGHPVGLTN